MVIWASAALASPVICDATDASDLLVEARIDETRAPFSHPELIPGLALASEQTEPELVEALKGLCADASQLSLVTSEQWETATWSAHTVLLTRTETRDCTMVQQSMAITVGLQRGEAPRYALRTQLPEVLAPIGDCPTAPRFREETVLAGEGRPVRLVLSTLRSNDAVEASSILVRRATPGGWREQVLMEPAPPRLLSGGGGPVVSVTERDEDAWIVAHGDRTAEPGDDCVAVPGQTVWRWHGSTQRWQDATGPDALLLLAQQGMWRLAGQDGWFVIVAQDSAEDQSLLAARIRRLQRKIDDKLHMLSSDNFPGLNPGFLIATPAPLASEEEAEAFKKRWKRRSRAYVRLAWRAVDPCVSAKP